VFWGGGGGGGGESDIFSAQMTSSCVPLFFIGDNDILW